MGQHVDGSKPSDPEQQNEGEGSRSAARRYDANAERAAKDTKKVQKLAEKAKQAVDDSEEGEELRQAEEKGKRGAQGHGTERR